MTGSVGGSLPGFRGLHDQRESQWGEGLSGSHSGVSGSTNSPRNSISQIEEFVHTSHVLGHQEVPLLSKEAVTLLDTPQIHGDFTHIHANRVKASSAATGDQASGQMRCLGQTPYQAPSTAAESQAAKWDLPYLTTLLDQAHKLKADPQGDGVEPPPAHITQFISPLAFHNPGQSKDRALSTLLTALLNQGGTKCADYTILSAELLEGSESQMESDCGLTRKFEVKYTAPGSDEVHTLILTEHAPDYRNGRMDAVAIEKAFKAMGGDQNTNSEVMLSYFGVGRVAIMQVVLDAKAQIEKSGVALTDEALDVAINAAIKNVEDVRGSYISRKSNQKEQIREALKKILAYAHNPIPEGSDVETAAADGATSAAADAVDGAASDVAATGDVAAVDDGAAAAVPPPAPPLSVEDVHLARVGLINSLVDCYKNAALKFSIPYLGLDLKVNPSYLKDNQNQDIQPYVNLQNELNIIVDILTGKTTVSETPSLKAFNEALLHDDLIKIVKDRASQPFTNQDQPFVPILQTFKDTGQQDAAEYLKMVMITLGIDDHAINFNAPYQHKLLVLNAFKVRQSENTPTGESSNKVWKLWNGERLELSPPQNKVRPSILTLVAEKPNQSIQIKTMKGWIDASLGEQTGEIELNVQKLLEDTNESRISGELKTQLQSASLTDNNIDLSKAQFTQITKLHIDDANADSKVVLNLCPYEQDPEHPKELSKRRVHDIEPFDLNEKVLLQVTDEKSGKEVQVEYEPTAFVFHIGDGTEGGHYIMLAKDPLKKGGKWVMHNDKAVRVLKDKEVKTFIYEKGRKQRPTMVLLQSVKGKSLEAAQPDAGIQSDEGTQPVGGNTNSLGSTDQLGRAGSGTPRSASSSSRPASPPRPDVTLRRGGALKSQPNLLWRIIGVMGVKSTEKTNKPTNDENVSNDKKAL